MQTTTSNAAKETTWQDQVREWASRNSFYGDSIDVSIGEACDYAAQDEEFEFAILSLQREREDQIFTARAESFSDRRRGFSR